jgi:hypothetical protein
MCLLDAVLGIIGVGADAPINCKSANEENQPSAIVCLEART